MSDELNNTNSLNPDYVDLLLKIKGAHLGVSTLGSDEPNMWLEAEIEGHYSLNLGNGRIDQLGGGSPNSKATINVDRSVKGLPFILVEKYKGRRLELPDQKLFRRGVKATARCLGLDGSVYAAARDCSTSAAKAAGSFTARSASILRSISMPDLISPPIICE